MSQGADKSPSLPWWVVAIAIAVAALFLSHAKLYLNPPQGQILQAPLSGVTTELLGERRPLVIEDRVVDPLDLARTVLRGQYAWSSGAERCPDEPCVSSARFTLVYFATTDGTIVIECAKCTPPTSPGPVAVVLVAGRVLVLPPGWRYTPSGPATRVRLHDPATAVMSALGCAPKKL